MHVSLHGWLCAQLSWCVPLCRAAVIVSATMLRCIARRGWAQGGVLQPHMRRAMGRTCGGPSLCRPVSVCAPTVQGAAVEHRVNMWTEEISRQRAMEAAAGTDPAAQGDGDSIRVLVNGSPRVVAAGWRPSELLKEDGFRDTVVVSIAGASQADGLWDLSRPLDGAHDGCSITTHTFASKEGQHTFWHSAAHVLGQALEDLHGDDVLLCDGPALEEGGFFYEMFLHGDKRVTEEDYKSIEKAMKRHIKKREAFQRMEVDREFAKAMFADNRFKLEMLDRIPAGEAITLYKCGQFVDLCRGPHVPNTGMLKGFTVYRSSGSHWQSNNPDAVDNDTEAALLQRAYGTAFPSKDELKEWKLQMEEAKKRDHRIIGRQQSLFLFHEMSPGSAFMLPHGTVIYNRLVALLRDQYRYRGYDEVMTPLIYKKQLWKQSGHLDNYHEDMFMVTPGMSCADHTHAAIAAAAHDHDDADTFGLKPMNCPGHCLLVAAKKTSYNDLPMRIADFSTLHRNEATGALGGLTRLRRFQQDDAHIFCSHDQIEDEVHACISFVDSIYKLFDFKFRLFLSTKPDKSMGSDEEWDNAERALKAALETTGHPFSVDEGGGAFYGPKIDIAVTDALGREHQCATIQLDFQLPQRFELSYTGADSQEHTPVIIHRAILGSVERMMAVLIEHTGGKWPFWLNPRQVAVCPVADRHEEYAQQIADRLNATGLEVVVDATSKTVPKRVRAHQMLQTSLILVVGDREVEEGTVAVRCRDDATRQAVVSAAEQVASAEPDGDVTALFAGGHTDKPVMTMGVDALMALTERMAAEPESALPVAK